MARYVFNSLYFPFISCNSDCRPSCNLALLFLKELRNFILLETFTWSTSSCTVPKIHSCLHQKQHNSPYLLPLTSFAKLFLASFSKMYLTKSFYAMHANSSLKNTLKGIHFLVQLQSIRLQLNCS